MRQSSESLKGDRWAPKTLMKYRFDNKWALMYNVLYAGKSAMLIKNLVLHCPGGGIGRRAGLKIRFRKE